MRVIGASVLLSDISVKVFVEAQCMLGTMPTCDPVEGKALERTRKMCLLIVKAATHGKYPKMITASQPS